jgi:hypothetical protein
MTDELQAFAIGLARPSFCEVQLQRFLRICDERNAITRQDVEQVYREMRQGAREGQRDNRRPKIVR